MTALFPNVPFVPGVPPVNRAPDRILAALGGAEDTLRASQLAASLLDANNPGGATTAYGAALTAANAALGQIDQVFSAGAPPLVSLYNAAGGAQGAINAIGAGDLPGAVLAGAQAVRGASEAIASLTANLNGSLEEPLPDSGPQVSASISQQWGLYTQGGEPAVTADNIIALDVAIEAQISNYPVENGGFGSYNKVQVPREVRLAMSRGGTLAQRTAFLTSVQALWASTTLVNLVTPEFVYLDCNVTGVRRAAANDHGLGLMTLDVSLKQVRQTARLAFVPTKQPEGAPVVNDGAVQTQPSTLAGSPR